MVKLLSIFDKEQETSAEKIIIAQSKDKAVFVSVPHSGHFVLSQFKENFSFSKSMPLDTDLYTDEIFLNKESSTITTLLCPHQLNMNRVFEAEHLEDKPIHLRGDALHTNSLIGDKILLQEYAPEEKAVLKIYYEEYHTKLQTFLEEGKKKHKRILLLDCHSYGSRGLSGTPDEGQERADINLGTLEGKSCDKDILLFLKNFFIQHGLSCSIDFPYKGGYITQKFANPSSGVNVIQIEVKKGLYMDERTFQKKEKELQKLHELFVELLKELSSNPL
ncbi:MAG: N-formylglutamate amidohydrolase [Nanoarchaeota archaeon]|nr:N-formylglutamate amidohydrolase [Nanoarchaeota archaeon]